MVANAAESQPAKPTHGGTASMLTLSPTGKRKNEDGKPSSLGEIKPNEASLITWKNKIAERDSPHHLEK